MESLVSDVRELTCMSERGGRIRWVSGSEVVVLDVNEWPESTFNTLSTRHPSLTTFIEAAPESLSGFAVRLKLDTVTDIGIAMAVVIAAVLAAVTSYCLDLL